MWRWAEALSDGKIVEIVSSTVESQNTIETLQVLVTGTIFWDSL